MSVVDITLTINDNLFYYVKAHNSRTNERFRVESQSSPHDVMLFKEGELYTLSEISGLLTKDFISRGTYINLEIRCNDNT